MPPALSNLLRNTDALIAKAKGAVAVAAKDIQKEVLYLCQKLDVARSADNREIIYAAVDKRIAKLANKLNQLFQYADDKAVNAANAQAAKSTGVKLQINKHHAKEIIDAVQRAGGENIAATMTANMEANVISSLRGAVVSAMRENALTGGGYKELQASIRAKWEAAAGSANGLGFVDARGRQWDTDAYLNMNVRTNAMRVFNDTLVTQIGRATGGDLVRVSRGGDPSCKLCFPWEGRILSITGKTKGFPTYDECKASGCFHPNCVHILEPVDEDLDADEIELQRQFTPPKDLADHAAMDEQRYEIDIARKMQQDGLDATAAKIAVDRDNLSDSIRNGLIREDADEIVAGLTDEQVTALCPNGNPPEFCPAKDNGGEEAWNKGKAGGVVYADRKYFTTAKLVDITDVGAGKPVEKFAMNFKPPSKEARAAQEAAQKRAEAVKAALDWYGQLEAQIKTYRAEAVKVLDDIESTVKAVDAEREAVRIYAASKGHDEAWVRTISADFEKLSDVASPLKETYTVNAKAHQTVFRDATHMADYRGQLDETDEDSLVTFTQRLADIDTNLTDASAKIATASNQLAASNVTARATELRLRIQAAIDAAVTAEKNVADFKRVTLADLKLDNPDAPYSAPVADAIKQTSPLTANLQDAVRVAQVKTAEAEAKFNAGRTQRLDIWKKRKAEFNRIQSVIDGWGAEEGNTNRRFYGNAHLTERYKDTELTEAAFVAQRDEVDAFIADNGMAKKYAAYDQKLGPQKDSTRIFNYQTSQFETKVYTDSEKRAAQLERRWAFLKQQRHLEYLAYERDVKKLEAVRDGEQLKTSVFWQLGEGVGGSKVGHGDESKVVCDKSRQTKWGNARALLEHLITPEVMPKERIHVKQLREKRAYQIGHDIYLSANDSEGVYIHEFAHWVEQYNPHVHERCQEFLRYRAEKGGTTEAERLRDITSGNYDRDEVTLKDTFFSPYCGKLYGKSDLNVDLNNRGQTPKAGETKDGHPCYKVTATEILSMGLQRIYEHPQKFYEQDPEYFTFCLNLVQGVI